MATKETELAIIEPPEEERRPLTAVQIKAQVQLIQEVMGAVMQKDVHYGVIPGCEKPTLYKPGSEKLLSTFRIAVKPIETDLSTTEVVRYRVEARGTSMVDGRFLGSGIGECSSGEEKYAWRRVVCKEEWEATPSDRRREKWAKKRNGEAFMMQQVRTNPADVANTILKMAKKRAQIDLTLTVTAASDIFTQDLEDLSEEVRDTVAAAESPKKPPIKMPERVTAKKVEKNEEPELPHGKTWWCSAWQGKTYLITKRDETPINHEDLCEVGFKYNEEKGTYSAFYTDELREMLEAREAEMPIGDEA